MIKVEKTSIFNFSNAIDGARNPLESWDKSDSYVSEHGTFVMGEKDFALLTNLVKAGTDHSKFMRQIFTSMNITAPLYWWKEMDTYKVATVANSTSTMHKMGSRFLTYEDFSYDKMTPHRDNNILHLNKLIVKWQKSDKQDKDVWRELIQDLPSSFNQMRTWTANYATLRNIYFARRSHKLSEWREFCRMIEELPYSKLITIEK